MKQVKVSAIIVAAGRSRRMGGVDKIFGVSAKKDRVLESLS